jgi:hypothetical protein
MKGRGQAEPSAAHATESTRANFPAPRVQAGEGGAIRKRPWVAAGETVFTNMGVWAYDRYVKKAEWAYISWSTIKANFRAGFGYDSDPFFTNLFLHPYHGTLYFNTARSLGLSFWGSTLYSFGGSLMWELFMENQRPSIDDLILTTTGGAYGGEVFYRLSSAVLDDTAAGAGRWWREVLGFVLDPWRGMNRLLFGDACRREDVNRQIREPMTGTLAVSVKWTAFNESLSAARSSFAVDFGLAYGERDPERVSRQPFDLIFAEGGLRAGAGQAYFNVDTYALLWGRGHRTPRGDEHLLGFFQDYDYLKNEEIEMGGSSFTAGAISVFPLNPRLRLQTSLQAGVMVFGASNNPYTSISSRDYNFGFGPVVKADVRLMNGPRATLGVRVNHYEIYTFRGAAPYTDESLDHLTFIKARAAAPLWKMFGVQAEYAVFYRHTHFKGHPSIDPYLSQFAVSALFYF